MAVAIPAVPMFVLVVRVALLGHVFLGGDLALADLRVRSAMRLQELLGPYDYRGWMHPGPAYFYLLAAFRVVVGDPGRSQFVCDLVVDMASMLGVVWVVRRQAGRWPALWASLCVTLLAWSMARDMTLSALINPWSAEVVVFPLVLFCILGAAATKPSWAALVGTALVGTFTVQTDLATAPLVAVLGGAALVAAVVRTRRGSLRLPWPTLGAGVGSVFLLWLPPLVQQATTRRGNLTQIWEFFRHHTGHLPLTGGLKLELAADQYLLGYPGGWLSLLPGLTDVHAAVILVIVLALVAAGVVGGMLARSHLPVAMGVASLLGVVVGTYAVARIYGPVLPYYLQWEIAVPVEAAIGAGVGMLCLWRPPPLRLALVVAGVTLATVFCLKAFELPVAQVNDAAVAQAWHLVAPQLPLRRQHVLVDDRAWAGEDIQFGLVDELVTHGYRAFVTPPWMHIIQSTYITTKPQAVTVTLLA
ncbi:MAG: glycosyltransferase family 39 protein, partial [Acidobacteriota bacterium]|nr:glycosyltransferase family 39 protein [Acidobacteriota bacterium]